VRPGLAGIPRTAHSAKPRRKCSPSGDHPLAYCTFIQVLVKVFLGYEAGVAKPTSMSGAPVYGQLVSERVKGVQYLELWPFDFPLNTKASTQLQPLHCLWKPQVSVFLVTQFAISGMERLPAGSRWRWVAQRWLCEPMTLSSILNELHTAELLKPKEIGASPASRRRTT